MNIIINPGTESFKESNLDNANKILAFLYEDLWYKDDTFSHEYIQDDKDGYYQFKIKCLGKELIVDIPGCDEEQLKYRRLYVDGSSWLYGFALNRVDEFVTQSLLSNYKK